MSFSDVGVPYDLSPIFTCIYSVPPDDSISEEYFVLPTLAEIGKNTVVPSGISLEIKEIASFLRQATLRFPYRTRNKDYQGAYKLLFKSRGKNQTVPSLIAVFK